MIMKSVSLERMSKIWNCAKERRKRSTTIGSHINVWFAKKPFAKLNKEIGILRESKEKMELELNSKLQGKETEIKKFQNQAEVALEMKAWASGVQKRLWGSKANHWKTKQRSSNFAWEQRETGVRCEQKKLWSNWGQHVVFLIFVSNWLKALESPMWLNRLKLVKTDLNPGWQVLHISEFSDNAKIFLKACILVFLALELKI